MKWLALVLLLVNVLLFAAAYNRQVESTIAEAMERPPPPQDAPGLQLLSELETLPALRDAAPPREDESLEIRAHLEASNRCLDIGPFAEEASRNLLRDWLRDYAAALKIRSETVQTRRLFWVYLEPTSEEKAQQQLDELHARGVEDYMLINRGDMKNAISLGVFRSQDSVNRRLAEMSEQGYKPVVVPQVKTRDQFWLTVRLAVGEGEGVELPTELLGDDAQAASVDCALF